MAGPSIINMINSYYPELTKAEKKIADYILKNIKEVIYMSVTDFAETVGVGEATILRFCQKIGYKGYQEFKIMLAKEPSTIEGSDETQSYIDFIKKNMIDVINETRSLINEENLEKAIDLIYYTDKVYFFGVGNSGLTAIEAKNRFLRYGKHVEAVVDPHFQTMCAATFQGGEVVVSITLSGSTKDIVESTEMAKKHGAKVIVVTNYIKSPITKFADIVLLTSKKEHPLDGGTLVAKISQLYVVDLLCTGVSLKDREKSNYMAEQTARAITNKIY